MSSEPPFKLPYPTEAERQRWAEDFCSEVERVSAMSDEELREYARQALSEHPEDHP